MALGPILWALKTAPAVDAVERLVLVILAEHADDNGRGAYPSQATIAKIACCTDRTVRAKLGSLEARGLIRKGAQARTQHLRGGQRPDVWDLVRTPEPASTLEPASTGKRFQGGTSFPLRPERPSGRPRKDVPTTHPAEPPTRTTQQAGAVDPLGELGLDDAQRAAFLASLNARNPSAVVHTLHRSEQLDTRVKDWLATTRPARSALWDQPPRRAGHPYCDQCGRHADEGGHETWCRPMRVQPGVPVNQAPKFCTVCGAPLDLGDIHHHEEAS